MDAENFKYIGIGLMSLAMMGAAIGVSNIFAAAVKGIARNPSAEAKIFKSTMIGAALAEAMGLFALVVVFMLLNK
jgi:F-type H+-transporting ATPase subunit c